MRITVEFMVDMSISAVPTAHTCFQSLQLSVTPYGGPEDLSGLLEICVSPPRLGCSKALGVTARIQQTALIGSGEKPSVDTRISDGLLTTPLDHPDVLICSGNLRSICIYATSTSSSGTHLSLRRASLNYSLCSSLAWFVLLDFKQAL